MRWEHLSRHLDLTEEQKNSVRSIMTEVKDTVVGDRREIRTLKKELANNLEPLDPVSAQLTADRIGAITTRIAFNASQAKSRFYALRLAPPQVAIDSLIPQNVTYPRLATQKVEFLSS